MKRFNIRVYAIIFNDDNQVLVSDENRFGKAFTKFPGGGLEWGEGVHDCLKRELMEELGISTEIKDLFYVNDFFQKSAFSDHDQLMSFYFIVETSDMDALTMSNQKIPLGQEGEVFRWLKLEELSDQTFTFPIDKIVANKLKAQ